MGFGRKPLDFDSCSFLNDKLTSSTIFFFGISEFWLLEFDLRKKETDFHKLSSNKSEIISGQDDPICWATGSFWESSGRGRGMGDRA